MGLGTFDAARDAGPLSLSLWALARLGVRPRKRWLKVWACACVRGKGCGQRGGGRGRCRCHCGRWHAWACCRASAG
eukprot:283026-Chlamydomonas_euryale.AAC.2